MVKRPVIRLVNPRTDSKILKLFSYFHSVMWNSAPVSFGLADGMEYG